MGVHGLWRLIEPSGKPVPLETLENKVLAVDISIWLHQAVKGFQDSKGASVPNAHLLGIYHRLCKLLYFKIKPVIVFDGGVPALKKQTIAKRNQSKLRNQSEADKIQKQLLSTLLKHSAVSKVLTEKIEASIATLPKATKPQKEDMYVLPSSSQLDSTFSSSEDESLSTETDSSPTKNWDLHTIDMKSKNFKSLPVDVRHEILTDLKETRKQNSWGRLHELPAVSDDFSFYQMKRLLKRQAVQAALEEAEKEMGGKSLSLAELESILKDQGVIHNNPEVAKRIASDDTTKYLLVKDLKKAIEEARQKENAIIVEDDQEVIEIVDKEVRQPTIADKEYEDDLQRAIALSLECEPSTSNSQNLKTNLEEFSFLDNFPNADFASSSSEDEEIVRNKKLSSAESYMLEYSGLTPSEIAKILNANSELKKAKLKKSSEKIKESVEVISDNDTDIESEKKTSNIKEIIVDSVDNESERKTSDINESHEETKNVVETSDDLVEIMSGTESSDTESATNTINIKEIIVDSVDNESEKKTNDEKTTNIVETSDDLVEIMSGTDSSDSESEKKVINIVINPNAEIEDDLFADVFAPEPDEAKLEIVADFQKKDEVFVEETLASNKTEAENTTTKEDKIYEEIITPSLSEKQLKDLKDQLQQEKVELINEKSTKERLANNITDQMYQEAQELLELFGVPYIIAPMEAEAQCAFLDAIELTDGTITDDSDIWLFGGKTVYKNFFNQSKYVMEFRSENIQHHFKLTREQMILLALLVGSDYTVGLQGVGPVTAMEILAAFPSGKEVREFNLMHSDLLSGLKEFRSWFTKGKSPGPGRSSLKSKLTNLIFTENFPSLQVVQAYLDPSVETSKEAFSWGRPNFGALLEYAREKFGWTRSKTEEIINPVLKKLEEGKHQKTIKDYFKTRFKVHSTNVDDKMSKRVKTAVNNMGRDPSEILAEEIEGELKQPKKRQVRKKKNTEAPGFSKNPTKKDKTSRESKVNLEKLKSTSDESETVNKKIETNKESGKQKRKIKTAETKKSKKTKLANEELNNQNPVDDVTEKINKIRQRRKINETKVKKPKEKKLIETIPDELQSDKEVKLLPKIVQQSSQKVEEINKNLMEKLKTIQVSEPSTSNSRPTRVPKKEVIPQKEKDKSTVLRNKLKAIEVYRKGKQGPGFVPKRGRNRRLPKADAGLSESSDDE
ncbi:unnamed protein product [Ceutorhynchus assimilis]|uniref:DNA repair protein complementing XP-G cells n=1 Tax=Ceutorhynchus assimilis TaxID=467358 RepID=A0A9P0GNF2_9CUCU|nr:unnamed protein product [Ceutorhynchus assimilis]